MSETLVSTRDFAGMKVVGGKDGTKVIGKVRLFVFHPKEKRLVGFIVKRPDLMLMFHRKELFVAFNGFDFVKGYMLLHDDASATDKGACKALGIDYDECVLWEGLPVMTEDGKSFGIVGNVTFDRFTGKVESFDTDSGATANKLLGTKRVPADCILGFHKGMGVALTTGDGEEEEEERELGAILVSNSVRSLGNEGGFAEQAGQAAAVASVAAGDAAQKAGEAVSKGMSKGAYAAGKQIAKSKTMFSEFKTEYDKARGPKPEKKKASDSASKPAQKTVTKYVATTNEQGEKVTKKVTTRTVAKKAPKQKNMFAAFKEEYDKASK